MKQRLLLALLVLFASVGTMWGADGLTFKVPSNIGTVTLTVTGDDAKTCIENLAGNSTISLNNTTYTIKNNSGGEQSYVVMTDKNVTKLSSPEVKIFLKAKDLPR